MPGYLTLLSWASLFQIRSYHSSSSHTRLIRCLTLRRDPFEAVRADQASCLALGALAFKACNYRMRKLISFEARQAAQPWRLRLR